MSRRRDIGRRLSALADIAGIMSAMKGLALMEIRVLLDFMAHQKSMVAGIEAAAADFLACHGEFASSQGLTGDLCVLVGSEQGFCGDFNETLLARCVALSQGSITPVRWVAVGRRVAGRMGQGLDLALPGAVVADEVPTVLLRLTRELSRLLAGDELGGYGLSALYHCASSGDIRLRRLLPFHDLPAPARDWPYPVELNLSPEEFFRGLVAHHLHAALNEVLYASLMAENRQRQAHMDHALQRLDEESTRLRLAYNIQRQEEITEEIETILLSADMQGGFDQ
jgi:F-type H+-transporting ATPase subunit gamma